MNSQIDATDASGGLDELQMKALKIVIKRKNVFITGPAGTGKTFLIHTIESKLQALGRRYFITAMTGTAATLLPNGRTFHSAMSVGMLNEENAMQNLERRIMGGNARYIWKRLDVVIIDEISMMQSWLLEAFDYVARQVRPYEGHLPFGGIQVVAVGDFFQLPPVASRQSECFYAFQTAVWKKAFTNVVKLEHIYRQSDDLTFAMCLNRIRVGEPTAEDIDMIQACKSKWELREADDDADDAAESDDAADDAADDAKAELLVADKATADKTIADKAMAADADAADATATPEIKPTHLYSRNVDVDDINKHKLEALKSKIYAFKTLVQVSMRPDATAAQKRAMTAARITKLEATYGCNEKLRLSVGAQVMLKHNLSVSEGLANGSRGVIVGFGTDIKEMYPIVKFVSGHEIMIAPIIREFDDPQQPYVIKKKFIPLKLAFALTIHSCQGASLDLAEIDIGSSIFESGQVYVALSRMRNTKGLSVLDFDASKIFADPLVCEYYEGI